MMLIFHSERKNAKILKRKNGGNSIFYYYFFLFLEIYNATVGIPVSVDNFPTQEESRRCTLVVVRFSSGFLKLKKDFKSPDVPAAVWSIHNK